MAKVVCVTGAGGFIASWIVSELLERGYTVHGTVRNPDDDKKNGHLISLKGAHERLILFKADVLDYNSLLPAIQGCDAVIHTACPVSFHFEAIEDVVNPAVQGTRNVLEICSKDKKIKRVVVTSSSSALLFDKNRPEDKVVDESCWSDEDFCKQEKLLWYSFAKTISEKLAWNLAEELKLDLVVICPVFSFGPQLQPGLSLSLQALKTLLDGSSDSYPDRYIHVVDVRDVARAHILAMENENASGRYLCMERAVSHKEILETLKKTFPQLQYPQKSYEEDKKFACFFVPPHLMNNSKIRGLIQEFVPFEQTLGNTVISLQEKGFI